MNRYLNSTGPDSSVQQAELSISLALMRTLPAVILGERWIQNQLHQRVIDAGCVFYGIETMCSSECFHHCRYRELGKKTAASWIKSESCTKMTATGTGFMCAINSAGCMF